jgi:hypothetical protein
VKHPAIWGLVVILSMAPSLHAQRAGVVLALPASARAAGASDASPLATGASALFYGGQNLPETRAVSASAGSWLGGAQFSTVAVALPWRGSTFGVGVQGLDYGSADEIILDPLTGGARGTATGDRVGASEFAITAGVGRRVGAWRAGLAGTFVSQQVADASGHATGLDAGIGVTLHGWEASAAVQHLGGMLQLGAVSSPLVRTYRGAAASPAWIAALASFRAVAEYRSVEGEGATALLGGEGTWASVSGWQLSLRGAAASYSVETARAPWAAGGSAARGGWSLDYAYQGFGALGGVHRMGVAWRSRDARSPSR